MGGIFAASVLAPTLLAVGILTLAAALALGAPAAFGGNDAPLSGPPALRDTLAAAAPDNVDITGDPTRVTGTRPPEDYRSGQPATGLAPAADTLFAELALVDAREIQPVLERVNQAGCGGRRGYLQYLCPSGDPPDASTLGQDVLVVHLAVNGPLRDTFAEFYGVNGDAAFASFMLDSDTAQVALERMARTAIVGGTGRQYGFSTGQGMAEEIVKRGLGNQARSTFERVASQRPLFTETITETDDVTETEGLEAGFMLDQDAQKRVQRRQQERVAAFSGDAETFISQAGAVGLGAARQ